MNIQIILSLLAVMLISVVLLLLWRNPELVLGNVVVSTTIFMSLLGLGLLLLYFATRKDRQ